MAARPHSAVVAKAARQAAPVMVGVLAGPAVGLSKDSSRWRRLTPLAVWTSINLRNTARTEILRSVAAVLDRQSMPARQLILIGEGAVARRALELVLQGALVCACIIANRRALHLVAVSHRPHRRRAGWSCGMTAVRAFQRPPRSAPRLRHRRADHQAQSGRRP